MRDVIRVVRVGALSAASAVLTLAVVVLADRVVAGRFLPEPTVMFPPHDEFRYHTYEFSAVARTNAMGFRDREFGAAPPPGVTRILAIGDSFTYGWAVENEEPWPKVLERRLVAAGVRAEVANLGMPGADPEDYAEVAEHLIPRLHPALTIVAVLQGDDLAQLAYHPETTQPREPAWKAVAHALIPNLLALRAQWRNGPAADRWAQTIWKEEAAEALAMYSEHDRARFDALNDDVRRAFLSGDLNPSLMQFVVGEPARLVEVDDPDGAAARSAIARMAGYLASIGRVASAYGSDLIVVSVPYGPYASARDYRNAEHIGFTLTPDMISSTRADEAIRRASEQAGVPFVSVTPGFRQAAAARELFFALDGHYTRAGHDTFAALVEPAVASRVSGLRHAAR